MVQPAQKDLQGAMSQNVYIRTDRLAVVISFVESFSKRLLEEMEITKNTKKNQQMKKQAFLILSKIESKEGKITIYTEMLNYKEYQNNRHTNLTKITVELHWENKKGGTK